MAGWYRKAMVLGGALIPFGLGCSDESPSPSRLTEAPPIFQLEPEVRIDGYAEDLVPIGRSALREDGVIAFVQGQDGKVVLYDSTGTRVSEYGRTGDGPGEFRVMSNLGWIGDTLWIQDGRARRTTWVAFDPDPSLLRTESWGSMSPTTAFGDLPSFSTFFPTAVYPDGTSYGRLSGPEGDPPELRDERILGRVTMEGELVGVVARYRELENQVGREMREGGQIVAAYTLSNPWVIEVETDFAGSAEDLTFVFTDIQPDNTVVLRAQRMAGLDTVWVREFTFAGVEVTPAMADSAIDARVEAISDGFTSIASDVREHYRREVTVHPVLPPLRAIYAGADGTLWMMVDQLEGFPRWTHLILDEEGRLAGQVDVEGGTVVEAGRDFAWLSVTDSLGVTSLVRNRLVPGG